MIIRANRFAFACALCPREAPILCCLQFGKGSAFMPNPCSHSLLKAGVSLFP